MAFYAALHYVDAYCCQKAGGSLNDHMARNTFVNTATDLSNIAPLYNRMYSRSRVARYDPGARFRRSEVQALLNDAQYIRLEILKVM